MAMQLGVASLAFAAVLLGAHAGEAATFDFDVFPDSAGCASPTPVGAGPFGNCDPDWAIDWSGGTVDLHQHTVEGLTLTLRTTHPSQTESVDWGFLGGVVSCGNQEDCAPFLADFSTALAAVSIDLIDVANTCGCGDPDPPPISFYLQAYSGANATGALLGEVILDASLGPATLAITAPVGTEIRSITFGASTEDTGECGGDCTNLGVADNLVATPVPEPASALLLGLGLSAVAATRRRAAR
jgi:hypothetical protein